MRRLSNCVAIVALVAGVAACGGNTAAENGGGGGAAAIGAPCTKDADCGGDFMCMTDHPAGYCVKMCDHTKGDTDCPSGSICQWDGTSGECHKTCTAATDCRTGYACAPAATDPTNTASHAFCDVAGP